MNKHLALAYAFAGLAVAAALIAFVTTSTVTPGPSLTQVTTAEPTSAIHDLPGDPASVGASASPPEPAVEYVYVDEPARAGDRHDDDDEDDEHENDEHEDGDDDREERGGHHDDDD